MKCPTCDVALLMTDRQGIEIDYCPQCRGVWLDRGELDKIIERNVDAPGAPASAPPAAAPPPPQYGAPPAYNQPHDPRYQPHDPRYQPHYKHKKKNLLGELFDF